MDQFFFDVAKTGLKFKGWKVGDTVVFDAAGNLVNEVTLTDNMTFKAIFTDLVTMTIDYALWNPTEKKIMNQYSDLPTEIGTASKTKDVKPDVDVDLTISLADEYKFMGWYSEGVLLSPEASYKYKAWNEDFSLQARFRYADFTLTAITEKKEYGTVRIGTEGGEDGFKEKVQQSKFYTEDVTIYAQAKTDIRFIGWYNENDEVVSYNAIYKFKMPKMDYTLTAKWNQFGVKYDLAGGVNNSENPKGYASGDPNITLKNPTREGYKFAGWTLKDETDPITEIDTSWAKDIELVAHWTPDLDAFEYDDENGIITITGVKDTSVTKLYIPIEVDSIEKGAFNGCANLEEITLPFIGANADPEPGSESSLFSYIFGDDEYIGGEKVTNYNVSPMGAHYVPTALKKVTFLGGKVNNYSLYNCKYLTSVALPDGITSIGNGAFSGNSALTSVNIPSSVTSIGSSAFSGCEELSSVTLPSGLQSLGNYAFNNCNKIAKYNEDGLLFLGNDTDRHIAFVGVDDEEIKKIELPDDTKFICDKACKGLAKLTEITLPSGLVNVGNYAFQDCEKLTSLTLPDSVKSIGIYLCSGCTALASVTLPENITVLPERAFYECKALSFITLPEKITTIGPSAFTSCESLSYITLPETLTSLGSFAFEGCKALTSIAIPDGVTAIGLETFKDCSSLASVTLPKELESIGKHAFYGTAVSSFSIPSTVTSIGEYAFAENKSLVSLSLPSGLTEISGCICENCTSLASITIPANVTTIWNYAFNGCTSLATLSFASGSKLTKIGAYAFNKDAKIGSVSLPSKVTTINDYAFNECTKLVTSLPSSLESLGSYAFNNCTSLTSISIPSGLTSLASHVFYGCSGLTSLTIHNYVTTISQTAIQGCSGLTELVLPDKLEYYYEGMLSGCSSLKSLSLPFLNRRLGYLFGANEYTGGTKTTQKYSDTGSDVYYLPSKLAEVALRGGSLSTKGMFSGCTTLQTIKLPYTLPSDNKTIGDYCFYSCYNLYNGNSSTAFTFPEATTIGAYAFYRCEKAAFWFASDYATQNIGAHAFESCYALQSPAFQHIIGGSGDGSESPRALKKLGEYAFGSCTGLTYLELRGSTLFTAIPDNAFYNCSKISTVYIYAKIKTIGEYAFGGCFKLTTVKFYNTSLTSIGKYALRLTSGKIAVEYAGTQTQWDKVSIGTGNTIDVTCKG